jgi:hypothetical protein
LTTWCTKTEVTICLGPFSARVVADPRTTSIFAPLAAYNIDVRLNNCTVSEAFDLLH